MSAGENNEQGGRWFGKSMVEIVADRYGPYAFGLVALLLIWYLIVAPELRQQRIEFKTQQDLVTQMQAVANTMETTATTLERIVDRQSRGDQ